MLWKLRKEFLFTLLLLFSVILFNRESAGRETVGEFRALEYEHSFSRELIRENQRLRRLHGFSPRMPLTVAGTGRVISVDPLGHPTWLRVETGAKLPGDRTVVVLDERGMLVGRVMENCGRELTVMTILSPQSTLSVVLQESRHLGVLKSGPLPLELSVEYIENKADITPGERVVTSSLSQHFPPGIPAGTVSRARPTRDLFQKISVRPAADFSRLEEVILVCR